MGKIVYNTFKLKQTRRALRNNQTQPEKVFWNKVKSRQFFGYKFRRQYSVGRYILDFYCNELKLGVEIDGETHFSEEGRQYDQIRTEFLEGGGIKTERFTNEEIMKNVDGVLEYLKNKYLKQEKRPAVASPLVTEKQYSLFLKKQKRKNFIYYHFGPIIWYLLKNLLNGVHSIYKKS